MYKYAELSALEAWNNPDSSAMEGKIYVGRLIGDLKIVNSSEPEKTVLFEHGDRVIVYISRVFDKVEPKDGEPKYSISLYIALFNDVVRSSDTDAILKLFRGLRELQKKPDAFHAAYLSDVQVKSIISVNKLLTVRMEECRQKVIKADKANDNKVNKEKSKHMAYIASSFDEKYNSNGKQIFWIFLASILLGTWFFSTLAVHEDNTLASKIVQVASIVGIITYVLLSTITTISVTCKVDKLVESCTADVNKIIKKFRDTYNIIGTHGIVKVKKSNDKFGEEFYINCSARNEV